MGVLADDGSSAGDRSGESDVAGTVVVSQWSIGERVAGSALAVAAVAGAFFTMVHAGVRLHEDDLGNSWQLIERGELAKDPLGSVWYLHIQPPLHNLVVGSMMRWSPFPAMGSIVFLYVASLMGIALLLVDLLGRWRVRPLIAGPIVALAMVNPNLLSTVGVASYEVPVTLLLVASVWWFQRQLQRPGLGPLMGLSASLTALAMTRSLFHPAFVVAVVVLAAVARKMAWRHVVVAVALPILVIGGWMIKNQVLFGTPTMSSWLGWNLQRGVTAPMAKDRVQAAVRDGDVTSLALEYPWGTLDQYEKWLDGCRPTHDHPAVTVKTRPNNGGFVVSNFNNECYLPLYQQSQRNAIAMIKREPGRYLSTRVIALQFSYSMAAVGVESSDFAAPGRRVPARTWMDAVGDRLLWATHSSTRMDDWNQPLLLGGDLQYRTSITLALLALGVSLRAVLAAVRLARSSWPDRAMTWSTDELVWLLVGLGVVLVILVGDLIEFGENGRFRSMLDPLLVALPLAALARIATRTRNPSARPSLSPPPSPPPPDQF